MKRFALLFQELDETTKTNEKTEALARYFRDSPPQDAYWALRFLCGRRPRRSVTLAQLTQWCTEAAMVPQWLFDECYEFVGDLAETIALLLPSEPQHECPLLHQIVEDCLLQLQSEDTADCRHRILAMWGQLNQTQRLIFNKLLTGGFRVGVSQKLVVRGLSKALEIDPSVIEHRLMGRWENDRSFFQTLTNPDTQDADTSRPYPFCLAQPLPESKTTTLGSPDDWLVEWKWDGIRSQLIRRNGQSFLWSRGEELITDQFPEIREFATHLPDGVVLDGELIAWRNGQPVGFSELQRRIGRKTIGRRILQDVPVRFIVFDLLELEGRDLRPMPLGLRRLQLQQLLDQIFSNMGDRPPVTRQRLLFDDGNDGESDSTEPGISGNAARQQATQVVELSVPLVVRQWQDSHDHKERGHAPGIEGLMLKRLDSVYESGRATGMWWKWKVDPYRCDAVLVYAQRGHGRRAGIFSDYTFAAWQNEQLVPFAKAYSGLTNEELIEVDRFIKQNTTERFGPVCKVRAELVFELAFEGLQRSDRHKSGVAVRFPRIVRWRKDKKPADADTMESIRSMAGSAE